MDKCSIRLIVMDLLQDDVRQDFCKIKFMIALRKRDHGSVCDREREILQLALRQEPIVETVLFRVEPENLVMDRVLHVRRPNFVIPVVIVKNILQHQLVDDYLALAYMISTIVVMH
jgi:hypothetical protein